MNMEKKNLHPIRSLNLRLGDAAIALILVFVAWLLPLFTLPEVGSLVSAATAVFAIVAGFFIADATGNYLRLQTLISEENAGHISIAHSLNDVPQGKPVDDAIDAYLIKQLDLDDLDHMIASAKEFEVLLTTIDQATNELEHERPETVASVHTTTDRLIALNQEITLAARSNLTWVHWGILLVLGALVALSVLAVRDGSLLMYFVAGALLIGELGVLMVLRDVDNNRFLQRKLGYRNPQQVFRALKRPPYYPPNSPMTLRLAGDAGTYRTRNEKGEMIEQSVSVA